MTVYPHRHRDDHPKIYTRSVILVNKRINTNNWEAIPIDCPDMTAVELRTDRGMIRIFNINNSCLHNDTLDTLKAYVEDPGNRPSDGEPVHYIWASDFNRHHPLWEEPRNCHLFTNRNLDMAEPLLELIATHYMKMVLPEQMPTLRAMASGNFTRVDNIFISDTLFGTLIKCTTHPQDLPPNTDHFPIETELDITAPLVDDTPQRNFRSVDWDKFIETLQGKIRRISLPTRITTLGEFRRRVKELDDVVDKTIDGESAALTPLPPQQEMVEPGAEEGATRDAEGRTHGSKVHARTRPPGTPGFSEEKERVCTTTDQDKTETLGGMATEHWRRRHVDGQLASLQGHPAGRQNKGTCRKRSIGATLLMGPSCIPNFTNSNLYFRDWSSMAKSAAGPHACEQSSPVSAPERGQCTTIDGPDRGGAETPGPTP